MSIHQDMWILVEERIGYKTRRSLLGSGKGDAYLMCSLEMSAMHMKIVQVLSPTCFANADHLVEQ